jgi:plasmid maintenance system antidote protein VapI
MPPKANWQAERTMTPVQYRVILAELGMNVAQAGRYLGVSERTSHRYVRGETEIPPATVLLLRAMRAYGIEPLVPVWVSDRRDAPRARAAQQA